MSDQLFCPGTGEWARTSTPAGLGSDGTYRSYSPWTTPSSCSPSESPVPFQSQADESVMVRSPLAPTDWYMLPMRELSGLLSGAWIQLTVVSAGFCRASGSSAASL